MSDRDDVERDGELIAFVADVREVLARRIETTAHRPAFGDAIARAHALRPDLVDEATVAEVRRLAPVVDLQRHAAAERALDELVADARAQMEARIRAARHAPSRSKNARGRGPVRVAIAVALAAAAAVVLVGSLALQSRGLSTEARETTGGEQAQLVEERTETVEHAPHVRPRVPAPAPPPQPAPFEEHVQTPAPAIDPSPLSVRVASPKRREAAPSLAQLASRAKQQWREGDLAAAESTLRQIVDRGGTTRWADNALSDLFALAYRRGDLQMRRHWWSVYLRRFPRGRFADDAHAGLCRTSADAECWEQYLERFPHGSYRREALSRRGWDP